LKLSQISHIKTTMMYNKYKSLVVIVVIVSLEKTSATVLLLILQQWSVLFFFTRDGILNGNRRLLVYQ